MPTTSAWTTEVLEPVGVALQPEDGLLQTDDEVLEPERGEV